MSQNHAGGLPARHLRPLGLGGVDGHLHRYRHANDPADDKTSPEVRDAAAVPKLALPEPLSEDDQLLLELYAEAITFWAEGFGRLRLVK